MFMLQLHIKNLIISFLNENDILNSSIIDILEIEEIYYENIQKIILENFDHFYNKNQVLAISIVKYNYDLVLNVKKTIKNINLLLCMNLEDLNIHYKDKWGYNFFAIDFAAKNGNLNIVKYLNENGIKSTYNTFDYSIIYGHLKIVKYLYENGLNCTRIALNDAVKNGNFEIIKFLYNNNCHKNFNSDSIYDDEFDDDFNILEWTCKYGNTEIFKFLYDKGEECSLEVNIMDMACQYNRLKIVKFLYEKNEQINKGMTLACRNGHAEIVYFLYDKGESFTNDSIKYIHKNGYYNLIKFLNDNNIKKK